MPHKLTITVDIDDQFVMADGPGPPVLGIVLLTRLRDAFKGALAPGSSQELPWYELERVAEPIRVGDIVSWGGRGPAEVLALFERERRSFAALDDGVGIPFVRSLSELTRC